MRLMHISKFNYTMGGPRESKWDKEVFATNEIGVSFFTITNSGMVNAISKL